MCNPFHPNHQFLVDEMGILHLASFGTRRPLSMSQTRSWWIACVVTSVMRAGLSRRKQFRGPQLMVKFSPQKRGGFPDRWDHLVVS